MPLGSENRESALPLNQPYQRPQDARTQTIIDVPGSPEESIVMSQRNVRSKRNIFVWSVTAFLTGALLIVMSSPYQAEFLAPGDLTSPHAQILAGQGEERCAACHANADQSISQWISTTLFGASKQQLTQSELCLKCHQNTLASATALKPHNLNDAQLEKASLRAKASLENGDSNAGTRGAIRPPTNDGKITCNACHREHHGSDHDMKAITDQQCQVCHQQQFSRFELDHPEFKDPVAKRRTRIAFDHVSHSIKHFPGKKTEFNCNQCHLDDATRHTKVLASYEQSCGQCHDDAINESARTGLTLFALPSLDMDAILEGNHPIGTWPLAATGDFDGPLPPLTRVLLAADKNLKPTLEQIPENFDFSDIDPDDPQSVAQAVELVWGLKRLMVDLAVNGDAAFARRLNVGLGIQLDSRQVRKVLPDVDQFVFRRVIQRWLPGVETEVTLEDITSTASNRLSMDDLDIAKVSWRPKDADIAAAFRKDLRMQEQQSDQLLVENPLTKLMKPSPPKATSNSTSKPSDKKPVDTFDGEPNPLDTTPTPDKPPSEKQPTEVPAPSTTSQPDPLTAAEESSKPSVPSSQPTNEKPESPSTATPIVLPDYQLPESYSGWMRDDSAFKLTYIPQGHADESIQQWINWAAASSKVTESPNLLPFSERILGLEGIGNCRSCHTMDRFEFVEQSMGALDRPVMPSHRTLPLRVSDTASDTSSELPYRLIHWKGKRRDPSVKRINRFSHAPHMTLPLLQDCKHCHAIESHLGNKETFAGDDPRAFISNFVAIQRTDCANCHRQDAAGSHCTQCHHYHVEHGNR